MALNKKIDEQRVIYQKVTVPPPDYEIMKRQHEEQQRSENNPEQLRVIALNRLRAVIAESGRIMSAATDTILAVQPDIRRDGEATALVSSYSALLRENASLADNAARN